MSEAGEVTEPEEASPAAVDATQPEVGKSVQPEVEDVSMASPQAGDPAAVPTQASAPHSAFDPTEDLSLIHI